jgi:hypothetical protein
MYHKMAVQHEGKWFSSAKSQPNNFVEALECLTNHQLMRNPLSPVGKGLLNVDGMARRSPVEVQGNVVRTKGYTMLNCAPRER